MSETKEQWRARIGNGPSISSQAMPTRSENHGQWARMKQWEKEHDAARALKKAGKELTTLAEAPDQLKALGG